MNKLYSIAFFGISIFGILCLDAKNPRSQHKSNKEATQHLLKKKYKDIPRCTFQDTYLGCDRDYIKEDTRGSKRGILADQIAKKYKK